MRAAALNPMGYPHFTDHLAAVAVATNTPLIFTDENLYEQSLQLYPSLRAELHSWQTFSAQQYDALFVSEMWSREKRRAAQRVVHCPHGFSDKAFWFKQCSSQDITLVYGQNMIDMVTEVSNPFNYVVVGNLRYQYYKEHSAAFQKIVQREVFSRFTKRQTTIFYAPTWRDCENSTSFFEAARALLQELPSYYNLIVKLHPNLEGDQERIVEVYEIISQFEKRANILFLSNFPLIYPLIANCDIYIGDRSAVGYDWLAFNKPMFFLSRREQTLPKISCCGITIYDFEKIYSTIEQHLLKDDIFSSVRKDLYDNSFAKEQPFEFIREQIFARIARD